MPPGARLLLRPLQKALNVGPVEEVTFVEPRVPTLSDIETRSVLPMAAKPSCSNWRAVRLS
jgi:hypothetical protein